MDLISENPTNMPSGNYMGQEVHFNGILGYYNGPYLMDKICETQYSNSSLNIKARSINLLDLERHLTADGIKARNEYNKDSSQSAQYGTTKTYITNTGESINTQYPSLYARQKGAGVNVLEADASSIMQPDITKGNDPYEESKKIVETEPTTNDTSETANSLTVTQTNYFIPINNTNYGEAANVLYHSTWYWVASRYVNTYESYAAFGLRVAGTNMYSNGVFDSTNDSGGNAYCLRPVVSLPSSLLSDTKDDSGAWNLTK